MLVVDSRFVSVSLIKAIELLKIRLCKFSSNTDSAVCVNCRGLSKACVFVAVQLKLVVFTRGNTFICHSC